jgi:hypothetical protein
MVHLLQPRRVVLGDAEIHRTLSRLEPSGSLKKRRFAALVLIHKAGDAGLNLNLRRFQHVFEMINLNGRELHSNTNDEIFRRTRTRLSWYRSPVCKPLFSSIDLSVKLRVARPARRACGSTGQGRDFASRFTVSG